MELEYLPNGYHKAEEVVIQGQLMFARVGGKWYGLNHRSCDPYHMRNREQRDTFARVVGVTCREVERYVRRVKRERAREELKESLADARVLLQQNGYNVIDTKDR